MWPCTKSKCELTLGLNTKVILVQTIPTTNFLSKNQLQVHTTQEAKADIWITNYICISRLIQYKRVIVSHTVVTLCDGIVLTHNSSLHIDDNTFTRKFLLLHYYMLGKMVHFKWWYLLTPPHSMTSYKTRILNFQHCRNLKSHIWSFIWIFSFTFLHLLYFVTSVTVTFVWPVDGPSVKILRCGWSTNRMNKWLSSGMMWIMWTCHWTGRDRVPSLHCRQLPVGMTLLTPNIGHHTWNSAIVQSNCNKQTNRWLKYVSHTNVKFNRWIVLEELKSSWCCENLKSQSSDWCHKKWLM